MYTCIYHAQRSSNKQKRECTAVRQRATRKNSVKYVCVCVCVCVCLYMCVRV